MAFSIGSGRILAATAFIVALGATGCSSDNGGTPPDTAGQTVRAPETPPGSTSDAQAPIDASPDAAKPAPRAWQRRQISEMPEAWHPRDGAMMAQLESGRVIMVGGWSYYDPWGPLGGSGSGEGGDRLTNEVWASDDLGITWKRLLDHDAIPPETGPNARFPPGHAFGIVVHDGHALLIGGDPNDAIDNETHGDVWRETNDGTTWTRISRTAPTEHRFLAMIGTYKGDIYVMGGQSYIYEPQTARNDVWRSTDGALTWTRLADGPWSPRGIVFGLTEHAGKLVVVGGGRYADVPYAPSAYNGVFAFDGTKWETLVPDGHTQFASSFYHSVISVGGRLWLFNGYSPDTDTEFARAMYSDDDGSTWNAFPDGAGGSESHADAVAAIGGRILRISGNLSERAVHLFE